MANAELKELLKMTLTLEQTAAISKWLDAKKASQEAQEAEKQARRDLVDMMFPSRCKGTQRVPLNNGYALKLVQPFTYKLGSKDLVEDGVKVPIAVQVERLCDAIEGVGNVGTILADRLVRWTPELAVPEYEKLDTRLEDERKVKDLIDALLTVSEGSPQLELEEPKKK